MNFKNFLGLAALPLLLVSCDSHIDDQTIITESQVKLVNPTANLRDFTAINAGHKVLLAVMDSGIDYNHPLLKQNIHFSLDQSGAPVSAGWDLIGNDPWPAPFVARTNYFNPGLSDQDRKKSLDMLNAAETLLLEYPDLARYFPSERNIEEEETEGVNHGTHVAGLASYDSPEIGIVGYRVLPMNIPAEDTAVDEIGASRNFGDILIKGLNQAIADGATVINMSLGVSMKESDGEMKKSFFDDFKKNLVNVVNANPEVIFVVAAGNDGQWIDGTSVSTLPCFIPKKNVICVSALTAGMELASFSNIIKNAEITTIFAWGDEILSTVPGSSCSSPLLDYDNIKKGPEARAEFAKIARVECLKDMSLKSMSGTSMASPVIARKIAKLRAQFPESSALEIKEKLFASAGPGKIGDMNVWKLAVEKPSWYSNQKSKKFIRPNWNFFILKK
ncbi:MAG TPA: S8 family serine peptidase [Bacteriovoracaceae bacterium]|nr:S8 family serine peptidase [Bacteriovoracaceae bacterium]